MPISLLMKSGCQVTELNAVSLMTAAETSHSRKEAQSRALGSKVNPFSPIAQNRDHSATEDSKPEAENKLRAILSSMSDPVFVIRKDGLILECHLPGDAAFALSTQNIIGKRLMELLPIQIAQQAIHYVEKALRTGHTQLFTGPYLILNKTRDFEVRVTPCGPGEAVALVRDVTARKLSEQEILEISNREQVRIGQDIHDGLGQHLTGVTFLSRALENKLTAQALPEASDAAEIGRLVLQALSQTRNLARGLFPVEIESNELAPALRELASTAEKLFNISCTLENDENVVLADRTVVNHLFRLAQEAINNSVKHGKAKRVVIGFKQLENRNVLTIRDNGRGFPHESTQLVGLGLRIMNYRAQKIGATFDIQPAEGGGTIVTCSFPAKA